MTQHIGIVACSAEGAALCYRTICADGAKVLGEHAHPEISMHTYPLAEYMKHVVAGDWEAVAELMLSSAQKLASCGAEFAICPDNTIHEAFPFVADRSPIPWIHIADAVASVARGEGFEKLGITGTKYLMTGPVYAEALKEQQLSYEIPEADDREEIDRIIFSELVYGNFTASSRQYFNRVFTRLKEAGCDAIVLGCTEIPLLVDPTDTPLPTLDSTRLLARAALDRAIANPESDAN